MKTVGELTWVKSTYSSGEGGQCVEVALGVPAVHVRDSKDTAGRSTPRSSRMSTRWSARRPRR
ncbi:DUF397 domain-containing protein [Streptomyces sp. NPDC004290]